ncbi:MAG: acetoacetate decarboxylase family protein [Desulfomonilaceae bacterium]
MFKFDDNKSYTMPAHFGGFVHDRSKVLYYGDVTNVSYTYTTDGDRLADYLPEGFKLLRPELNIIFTQSREIDWMAGSSYNLVEIGVPARFSGKHDLVEGQFALVVWENKTTPIIGGREETGIPKIFADIEDLHIFQGNCFTNASYEGNTFLHLEMTGAQPLEGEKLAQLKSLGADRNLFGWRYIGKVGGPGPDLSQPILYPQSTEINSAWTGSGRVQWIEQTWQQNPMQFHIIKALAELPIIEMAPVLMIKCVAILKPAAARVLE